MNITKHLPKAVTLKAGRTALKLQKSSPTLLFAAGVTGVVASTVMACRATLRIDEVMNDHRKDLELIRTNQYPTDTYTDDDRSRDLALKYMQITIEGARLYAPAVFVGVASITCLVSSHKILNTRNAGLTAAYVALDEGFKKYRARVVESLGLEKDEEFRHGVEVREYVREGEHGPELYKERSAAPEDPSVYARFFDETSQAWSPDHEYNVSFLKCQQNFMNDRLRTKGHVFLNEVYDALGLERSKAGNVVGWFVGKGDDYIDFGIWDSNRERARAFVNHLERGILLDFNVDGPILSFLD